MSEILTPYLTHPIEREYEAWIIREIEDFFQSIGVQSKIVAVSPTLEKIFPADAVSSFRGKVIGLQFKRALIAPGSLDFSRLHWDFSHPSDQIDTVLKFDEVYYCLPTFINRKWKRASLHHCLFWRPKNSIRKRGWYSNEKVNKKTTVSNLDSSMRWGRFLEGILSCKIGARIEDAGIEGYLASMRADVSERNQDRNQGTLYLVFFEWIDGQFPSKPG